MPLILRVIRKDSWRTTRRRWLRASDFPADPVTDLKTMDNCLSVYEIADDQSNLERVITAIAGTREYLGHVDYMLFDAGLISEAEIEIQATDGGTPDEEVNRQHQDLIQLTSDKLVSLAKTIYKEGKRERLLGKTVVSLLRKAIEEKRIRLDGLRLKEKYKEKLLRP